MNGKRTKLACLGNIFAGFEQNFEELKMFMLKFRTKTICLTENWQGLFISFHIQIDHSF